MPDGRRWGGGGGSSAGSLQLLPPGQRDAGSSSTFGTGELIRAALDVDAGWRTFRNRDASRLLCERAQNIARLWRVTALMQIKVVLRLGSRGQLSIET